MDTKSQPIVDRIYEDFEPYYEWAKDEGCFTFMLPGFRRDHLKVQVTSKPALKLKGERQISPNRWRRFELEFPIPSDYDLEKVSAKFEFEGSKLQVKFAKKDNKPKETTTTTTNPPEEATEKVHQQNAAAQEEVAPKAKEDKAQARSDSEISDQKVPHKEKEPSDQKVAQEKGKANNGITETKNAKPITRFKTTVLGFDESLGPSNRICNEELGDNDTGINKRKRLMNCSLLTLLVVGIGLCAKTAFSSSSGGSKFQEQ